MSTLLSKKPISVVIFDRTQAGMSDVPIFAQKLKEKVNTPIPREISDDQLSPGALSILGKISSSVLRADSSGGQTGEFAQSTDALDIQHSPSSLQQPAVQSELEDDPALDRRVIASVDLDDVLNEFYEIEQKIPPLKLVPYNPFVLHETHKLGYLERVILPIVQPSLVSLYTDNFLYISRKVIRKIRRYIPVIRSVFQTVGKTAVAIRLPLGAKASTIQLSKIKELVVIFHLPEFDFARLTSKILIAGSLVLMLMTVGPMVALEVQSIKQKISYAIMSLPTRAEEGSDIPQDTKPTPIPSANPDPEKQFQIVIPKIGVNSKVIANVDPGNEKAYTEALKKGVAHAAGTGLPGESNTENKTIFIFGHSTNGEWNIARYNALFYALKDLTLGDTLSVWFWGKEYHYRVTKTEIVASDDVSFLIPQTSKDQLILQTCWPPGTSWKRFLVIAEPLP